MYKIKILGLKIEVRCQSCDMIIKKWKNATIQELNELLTSRNHGMCDKCYKEWRKEEFGKCTNG